MMDNMVEKKMNVVFIMADQQRADSIGPGRNPLADYPNMNKLCSESVNFDSFYAAAIPCVPSRHSYLTGRHPWMLGVHGNSKFSTEKNETTWMSVLRDNGYTCVSVGKTHMVHTGSFHIQVPVGKTFGSQGGWNHFNPEATSENEDAYFDIHTTNRACEALEVLKGPDPFAMFIGFHAPHEPYVMPEKYLKYCKPEDVPLPTARHDDEYKSKSEGYRKRVELFRKKFGNIDDIKVRKGIAGHYCLLKMVDDCLGTIMKKLEDLKLLDNTFVIYTSDHGDLLGEHWIFNKAATFYESEVRIPFMIRFPDGYKAGTIIKSLASSIDYMPTLIELLKLEPDISLPGYSLMPVIEKGGKVREFVTSAANGSMMVRDDRYKLWYNSAHQDGELYDLKKDPDELDNLYDNPEYVELRRQMFEKMLHSRMLDDTRNNLPTNREKRLHLEIAASNEPEV